MFGVSEGTLEELVYALEKGKLIKLFFDEFDPGWREHYEKLRAKYGNPLEGILGNNF